MTIKVTKSYDGVDVPDEGVKFDFVVNRDGEEQVRSIVLHDTLAGLRLKVSEGKTQSQAMTFASYALQKGFETEQAILDAFPKARPFLRNGQIESRAWSLISTWEAEVQAERQRKARQTMREEGTEISPGQMQYAFSLVPTLREHDFHALAQTLLDLLQVNEEAEGPHGAEMSAALSKAKALLDMAGAQQGRQSSSSEGTTRSTRPVSSDEKGSEQDPF